MSKEEIEAVARTTKEQKKETVVEKLSSRKMILSMWGILSIVAICKLYYGLEKDLMETSKPVTTISIVAVLSGMLGQNILQWWLDKKGQ